MFTPPGLAPLSWRLGDSFPGKNFLLVDSDCLPVTLFEAFDLWQKAYLTRILLGASSSPCSPEI